jgi:hypothetical protein
MNKKYYTPMVSDLYRAPRSIGDINDPNDRDKAIQNSVDFKRTLLSSINARIDYLTDSNKIGEAQALQIFDTARKVVIETIQLN